MIPKSGYRFSDRIGRGGSPLARRGEFCYWVKNRAVLARGVAGSLGRETAPVGTSRLAERRHRSRVNPRSGAPMRRKDAQFVACRGALYPEFDRLESHRSVSELSLIHT